VDVVVSGASGLIGTALSASLRADGHRVLRLVRGGVTDGDAIGWDPDAARIDAPALEGVDAVVHLAGEGIGEHRWSVGQKAKIRDSRVRSTALLAGAIGSRERKPNVFVSGSAIGYYGNRGDEVLTEQSPPGDDYLARVAVAWEAEAAPAIEAGVRTVFTRTGIVLDAGGGALARMLLPFKLGLGGKQGSGTQWMSWIANADEVGAIRHAIENRAVEGPVNCVAPNPVTNADFARALGRALRRPTVLPTPLLPLKLRYGGELVETLLLFSQRVAPAKLEATGYEFTWRSLDDALAAILHGRDS
jgi:uncharacterized protein (TIGR01777 family)